MIETTVLIKVNVSMFLKNKFKFRDEILFKLKHQMNFWLEGVRNLVETTILNKVNAHTIPKNKFKLRPLKKLISYLFFYGGFMCALIFFGPNLILHVNEFFWPKIDITIERNWILRTKMTILSLYIWCKFSISFVTFFSSPYIIYHQNILM